MNRYFFIVFTTGISICASAQQKEIELDPITITATLTPKSALTTGRNIILIKGEQINKLPVNSIDELIRYLPGVEVQSRGPMGAQSNITIRGGTFQQVLIILDGIRLNDPLSGHFNSYIPIAPAEIDRIEILKGASSAVYGTEAVGGVVHIITKTFAAQKGKQQHKLNAQVTAGEYGLRNAQAGFSWQKNKTAVAGGLLQNVADGQPLRGTNGFFNLTTISLSAKQYINDKISIAYRGAYDDRNFNAQNFYTNILTDSATERVITRWHHLNFTYQHKKHRFSFDGGAKDASDKYQFRKSAVANTNRSNLYQALALHNYNFNKKSSLTSGVQLIERSVQSNNRGNHSITTAGVFVILNQQIAEHFTINPALRVDWNERAGLELIPQLNLSYRYEKLQLRASAGRSTRDADFTERFNNYQPATVAAGNRIGNPDLEAENAFSYEAGADYLFTNELKVSAGWFQRYHNGLIDYVSTPYSNMPRQVNLIPGATYSLAKNIDKVNTKGIETDIQYSKTFSANHTLIAAMGFVWINSKSSDSIPSLYVSNHAKYFTNFSVQYRYKFISIAINGLYKQRRPQTGNPAFVPVSKDYFLMNARLEGHFIENKLGVFIQADNVFNRRYSDILGTVMPNRWLMGGIKVSL
ncbi:MAG: TonB-dependent receptor [Chitinophagaceae bacterium]|nr:TonB-dependent receptor [Chitinophagaceae bacterium]